MREPVGGHRVSGVPVFGVMRGQVWGLFGADQRITSGPAARRPHGKAGWLTAPERFADSPRNSSCTAGAVGHDPKPT